MSQFTIHATKIRGWHPDEITVFAFHGVEEVSAPHQYEVGIIAPDTLSAAEAVGHHLSFIFKEGGQDGEDLVVHGKLAAIDTIGHFKGKVAFRLLIVPTLWNLSLAEHSRIWTQKTIPQIFELLFKSWGLTNVANGVGKSTEQYELRLFEKYPVRDIVSQFNETDLAFISRWMEREGMYYYFEQHLYETHGADRIIITDQQPDIRHPAPSHPIYYGGDGHPSHQELESLHGTVSAVSYEVHATDYNYMKPDHLRSGTKRVRQNDQLTSQLDKVFLYGEHFADDIEGSRIVEVRADAIASKRHILRGEGVTRGLKIGRVFACESPGTPRPQHYMVTRLEHWGCAKGTSEQHRKLFDRAQLRSLGPLALPDALEASGETAYRVRFECVPAGDGEHAYRHPQETPIPVIHSMTRGTVIKQLPNDHGVPLYQIKLDFDELQNQEVVVRATQPHGAMQFSIKDNTEVLVEFLAGNVDRPVIANVVPNPLATGPVAKPGSNLIQSDSNNSIEMNDNPGEQSITTSSPIADTFLRMGEIAGGFNALLNTQGSTQFAFGQMWNVSAGGPVTHAFADRYDMSLAAPTNDYKYSVENTGAAYGRVTELAGEIHRTADQSHSLTVGTDHEVDVGRGHTLRVGTNGAAQYKIDVQGTHDVAVSSDYTLAVQGTQTVTAKSYGMSVGSSSMTVDPVNGYTYLPDHIFTVQQDQRETVQRDHYSTIYGNHSMIVGTSATSTKSCTYDLNVGSSNMTVDSTYGFIYHPNHTVTVQQDSSLTVQRDHSVLVQQDHFLTVNRNHAARVSGNYDVQCHNYSLTGEAVTITSNMTIIS